MKQQMATASNTEGLSLWPTSISLDQPLVGVGIPSLIDNLYLPDAGDVPLNLGRVLFAEDDDDLRECMTIFLFATGYSVTAHSNAELATEAFRSDPLIDILMTDMEMPGRSGLELARELTALRSSLPVVIVSGAFVSPEMASEIKQRGWTFLSKPCGLPIVLQALQSGIGHAQGGAA